jgi:glycosyltransferase involved in cell wall biosynthesis
MHVLFIHQAFPAQFGRLGLELNRRHGWECSFLIQSESNCPTPTHEMLELPRHRIPLSPQFKAQKLTPWAQSYGRFLELAHAVAEGVRALPRKPDLVVGHDGLGPTLLLPEVIDCPTIDYCEYYFAPERSDISYRIDLPPAEPAQFYPRTINAGTLVSLHTCTSGYAPTHYQRETFPERWRHKIEVHFDGIDTELYRPRELPRVIAGRTVPADTRIVTFVARGLESMRGFDLFMRLAERIERFHPDVLFVVVGQEESYYSWDKLHTGQDSFKQWVLEQGHYDLSRFLFFRHLEPADLANLLCLSDLHVYLTVPFVLSWSLFNALACGCVVLASDVAPVREVIRPDVHGLIEPLFDTERQLDVALRVLKDPAAFRPLGQAARRLLEEKYSLEVAIPELKTYFERVATGR